MQKEFNELIKKYGIVILKNSNTIFFNKPLSEHSICGLSCEEIIKAIVNNNSIVIDEKTLNSLKDVERFFSQKSNYIIISENNIYLTKSILQEIISYYECKQLDVCYFTGGVVFKKNANENNLLTSNYSCESLKLIESVEDLQQAQDYFQSKIIKTHLNNGVIINSPNLVRIDYKVKIKPNTQIYGATSLLGSTKIGGNCTIVNSVIIDKTIDSNSIVSFKYLF